MLGGWRLRLGLADVQVATSFCRYAPTLSARARSGCTRIYGYQHLSS